MHSTHLSQPVYQVDKLQHVLIDIMRDACAAAGDDVLAMIDYHFSHKGSFKRASLCYQTASALNINTADALKLSAVVELLHNASLIHDDIQDKDPLRRNALSLWLKFGEENALCVGDSLILAACLIAAELDQTSAKNLSSTVIQLAQQTIRGQVADLHRNASLTCSQYRSIATDKAAPLIQLAVMLPCLFVDAKHWQYLLNQSASNFALAYQLYDDVLDAEADAANHQPNAVSIYMYEFRHQQHSDPLEHAKTAIIAEIYLLLNALEDELIRYKSAVTRPLLTAILSLKQRLAGL